MSDQVQAPNAVQLELEDPPVIDPHRKRTILGEIRRYEKLIPKYMESARRGYGPEGRKFHYLVLNVYFGIWLFTVFVGGWS